MPLARHHEQEVHDLLHDEPQHAGNHEDPEQVEEVQRDVALTRRVAPEGAVLALFVLLGFAGLAVGAALFQHDQVEGKVDAHARQHDGAQAAQDEQHVQPVGQKRRPAPLVAQKPYAEDDERRSQGHEHRQMQEGNHDGGDPLAAHGAGAEHGHGLIDGLANAGQRHAGAHDEQHAEHAQHRGQPLLVGGARELGGDSGRRFVEGHLLLGGHMLGLGDDLARVLHGLRHLAHILSGLRKLLLGSLG